jgi:hypothetical protein
VRHTPQPRGRTRSPAAERTAPRWRVLILGPLLGVVAAGCASFPETAARQMQDANRAYLNRKYAASEQLLTPVIERHGRLQTGAGDVETPGVDRAAPGSTGQPGV